MPQKGKNGRKSVFASQIFDSPPNTGTGTANYEVTNSDTAKKTAPINIPVPANAVAMKYLVRALDEISQRDNNLRWELTSAFTIAPGPTTTNIPFNNENIGGDGAKYTSGFTPTWRFRPPPKYAGTYRVSAFFEFLSGAMANILATRLELWIERGGYDERWCVLDKVMLDTGNTRDDDYLEMIVMHGSDIVPLDCDETLTVKLYTAGGGGLIISDMNSCYGYVGVNYLGCKGKRTDIHTQSYLLPDNL